MSQLYRYIIMKNRKRLIQCAHIEKRNKERGTLTLHVYLWVPNLKFGFLILLTSYDLFLFVCVLYTHVSLCLYWCMCMCECILHVYEYILHVCEYPWKPIEGIEFPGIGVPGIR